MIGFNALGRMGRLGNQMFQYAALKGMARNIGADITIPFYSTAVDDGIGNMLRTELFDSFDINVNIGLLNNGHAPVVQERHFHFDEELFKMCPDHVDLRGYFQTEKYFKHIEDEIRQDFTFVDEVSEPCKDIWKSIFGGADVLSLHVRRGDYVGHTAHPVQSMEYYKKALSHFFPDQPVLLCSDDPDWCRGEFTEDRFMISDGGDTRVDLCLMTMCKYHIIANSSYSWWGAWLANSEKVIAPSKWFTGELAHKDTTDIYCPGWILI